MLLFNSKSTQAEWSDAISSANGNTVTYVGTNWTSNETNFSSGARISNGGTIKMHLPGAGYRSDSNGALENRGFEGSYWTSTMGTGDPTRSYRVRIINNGIGAASERNRGYGYSVRCIKQ